MTKKEQSRIAKHLLGIGFYIVAALWLAFSYAGVKLVSTPESGHHSHLAGWVTLIVTTSSMLATIDHWVKYLRVFFGGGVLGGLLALESGHLLNGSPFPRAFAAWFTALLIVCSIVVQSLSRRKLTTFDRIALVAFVAAFVGGIVTETPLSGLVGLSIGFGFLLAAWTWHRFSSAESDVRVIRRRRKGHLETSKP